MKILPLLFLLDEENNILLLHRIDRKTREPIKGGLEEGESPEEGIIRELYEETGIKKEISDLIKIDERTVGLFHKMVYVIQLSDIKPHIDINYIVEGGIDHDNYGWFSLNVLENLPVDYQEEFMEYIFIIKSLNNS